MSRWLRKVSQSILLLILLTLLVGIPVLAATFTAPLAITETSGTAYGMLPVITDAPIEWMVSNNYMDADGLDTRVQTAGGTIKPHMVVDDKILFATAVPADSQTNLVFSTGNTSLSATDVITGYDGYITIADIAGLELGNNFEIETKSYIDTSSGSDKNIVHKSYAYKEYIQAAQAIRAAFITTSTPTIAATNSSGVTPDNTNHTVNLPAGINAGDLLIVFFAVDGIPVITFPSEGTDWIQLFENNDGANISLAAAYRIADGGEGASITVTTNVGEESAHTSYRITGYAGVPEAGTTATGNDANPNPPNLAPSWGHVAVNTLWLACEGSNSNAIVNAYPANYNLNQLTILSGGGGGPGCGIGTAGRALAAVNEDPGVYTLNGASQWAANTVAVNPIESEALSVTVTGVTSGERIVNASADGANLTLSVTNYSAVHQGNSPQSVALAGASVTNNDYDWLLFQSNVVPYTDYYKHTVGGALVTRFEPNDIIDNTSYDGTADAGGDTDTIIDAELTQANDYWNLALVTITDTTDDLAPEGETAVVEDFIAVTDEITLATALTAGIDAGDTYTVEFGTLPDREVAGNDGRITWGVNPTGVGATLSSLVSTAQPSLATVEDDPARDLMPEIETSDWFVEPAVAGSLLTNPIRPFVTIVSDNTILTELQTWRWLGLSVVLLVTVTAIKLVPKHLAIACFAGGAMTLLMVVLTIWPLWTLAFLILFAFGGWVSERSPSL